LTYINSYASLIANLAVPIFISSGDNGSAGDTGSGLHVGFPASVPTAYACGGTTMTVNAAGTTIIKEVSWTGSGGGVSKRYAVPAWQTSIVSGKMRGVPDFSGNADPKTGYKIYTVSTGPIVVGGTSAVAPLMTALFALVNENRAPASAPKIGSINSQMYTFLGMNVYRDITLGSNGAYSASRGWDPVTGLGVINGKNLLKELYPETAINQDQKPPAAPKPLAPILTMPIFNSIIPKEIFIGRTNVPLHINGINLQTVTAVFIQGRKARISKTVPTALTMISPNGLIKGPAAITLQTSAGSVTITGKVNVTLQKSFARRLSN